jgi:hypothetical protein
MGLFAGDLRFLLSAKRMGLQGSSVCTLGRHTLLFSQRELNRILKEYDQKLLSLLPDRSVYVADDVLRLLGFERVDVLDASDYEGANILHDLNIPVPPEMHEQYDLILDGGTIEHVFNFPVAIESAMRMAKVGGDFIIISPANNYCGHGFYQLSPELFFRIFIPENGFKLLRIYMHSEGRYYHIVDPVSVHGRVELLDSKPALVMVHARKIAHVPEKIQAPQQSDYVTTWAEIIAAKKADKRDGRLKSFIRARISPASVTRISKILFYLRLKRETWEWKRRSRLSNRKLYMPVTQWEVTTSQALNQ